MRSKLSGQEKKNHFSEVVSLYFIYFEFGTRSNSALELLLALRSGSLLTMPSEAYAI